MKKKQTKTQAAAATESSNMAVATTTPNTAMAYAGEMFAADAGAGVGTEGAGIESYAIPFLHILQKGSPQVDEASPGTLIPGAKAGMLYETVGSQVFDGKDGVLLVPCAYRRAFLRWGQDDSFKAELDPEDVARRQQNNEVVDVDGTLYVAVNGKVDPETSDYLVEVRNHYVLLVDEKTGEWRQALLSLKSTQIKKSRRLMTALVSVKVNIKGRSVTPATFANLVRATTVAEANDKGTWFGWKLELAGFVKDPALYAAAKEFHAAIVANRVETNYGAAPEAAKPASGGGF